VSTESKKSKTRSERVAADLAALFRARNPVIWIQTPEEARVEKFIYEAAGAAQYGTIFWDVDQGMTELSGKVVSDVGQGDPDAALAAVRDRGSKNLPPERADRNVWVMRDLPVWLNPPLGSPIALRKMRNLARWLPGRDRNVAQSVVVLTPSGEVPPELANHATVINWPMPDRDEIAAILDAAVAPTLTSDVVDPAIRKRVQSSLDDDRDASIDAAIGLSGEEAKATFAFSLVKTNSIDPALIAQEKKRVIAKENVIEWFDPLPGGLSAVGGLECLKDWLISREDAYSPSARAYGLRPPKGALLVGVPGCGKSLVAKAIATAWGVPLLRLDLGALKSKFVGESEQNLRKAFNVIEAIGRCVVWLDEIEKALAGATGEAGDGGVSSDALGALLSWMQDRSGEAFVIATANNAEKLPPELTRKGRFDCVWWVDLPTAMERASIVSATMRSVQRDGEVQFDVDVQAVAEATGGDGPGLGFTGSEVAELIPDAMFAAFNDGQRAVTTEDLLAAIKDVVPLARQSDKIGPLREYWLGKARPASVGDELVSVSSDSRQIDF
jgi:hypothetical protein